MQCPKPTFLSVKKEVEKKLVKMEFKCKNHEQGCNEVLKYLEVQEHDENCEFRAVRCQAFSLCRTKVIQREIFKHEAVCPYIEVPCIYCKKQVQRMNIIVHEQEDCVSTFNCDKCGLTVRKEDTKKRPHNCFNSMAGYLTNMLKSKDYVISMFKEEI